MLDMFESVRARVPKTKCRCQVLLSSVVQASDSPAEEKHPTTLNPADPNSQLTQRKIEAANQMFKKKLPIVQLGAIPLYNVKFHNLLPRK